MHEQKGCTQCQSSRFWGVWERWLVSSLTPNLESMIPGPNRCTHTFHFFFFLKLMWCYLTHNNFYMSILNLHPLRSINLLENGAIDFMCRDFWTRHTCSSTRFNYLHAAILILFCRTLSTKILLPFLLFCLNWF